jgi:hypothetical protein
MGFFSGLVSSIAGPVVGGLLGLAGQKSANSANAALADKANETSIELANSAHQREVKDLMAAGLNPMLSYHTSGSATPQLHVAKMENTADSASRSASAASNIGVNSMQKALMQSQIDTQQSQADLNSASAAKVRAETPNVSKTGLLIDAQVSEIGSKIEQIAAGIGLTNQEVAKIRAEIPVLLSQRKNIDASTLLHESQVKVNKKQLAVMTAEIDKLKAATDLERANIPRAASVSKVYESTVNSANQFYEALRNVRPAVSHWLHNNDVPRGSTGTYHKKYSPRPLKFK